MEELDEGRYSVKPSSPELAVEIVNGTFAWDSVGSTQQTTQVAGLRALACRRRARSKVKRRGHGDAAAAADNAAEGDPMKRLYEAVFSHDDSPAVLFDINFAVTKVVTASNRE